MADIRISQLPDGTPTQTKYLPMDLAATEKATVKDIVFAGRPAASQAEAEAGTDPDKAMTPLTTAQAIAALGATKEQGEKADTALQPDDAGDVSQLAINILNRRFVMGLGADPVVNAQRIAAAYTEWGDLGVGEIDINFPSGTYEIGVPPAYQVGGAQEGSSFRMESGGMVNFVGHGTILVPATNEIEMFIQNGAADLGFYGLVFDNSANGILNNQVKPSTYTLGGGVAGLGNGANAAIRQYRGANLKIDDCRFVAFNTAVEYIGDFDDFTTTVGIFTSRNMRSDGCAFPHLIHQPKELYLHGGRCENNVDSLNSGGSTTQDPGHYLYLTNRSGGFPDMVVISDIWDRNGTSSALKVRKGKQVVITNVNIFGSGRGIEVSNCEKATVSNAVVSLSNAMNVASLDNGPAGLELVNSGYVDLSDIEIDIRGCSAFGARIQTDLPTTLPYANRGSRVKNLTVMQDYSNTGGGFVGQDSSIGKVMFICVDQVGIEIDRFRHIHYGTVANTRAPIDLRNCDDARIIDARHICPDGAPADKHRVVQFDVNSSNGYVSLEKDAIDPTAPLVNTSSTSIVTNLGTGNKVVVAGGYDTTYQPSVTFATAGDFNPSYDARSGTYYLKGEFADVWFDVQFDANAYTTAGGEFRITMPFAASSDRDWGGTLSIASKIDLGAATRSLGLIVPAGASYAVIRENQDNAVGGNTLAAGIPPSTTDVRVSGSISFKRA